jgi:2-keto-3-deoxy-6-phosphogluconate aldolase
MRIVDAEQVMTRKQTETSTSPRPRLLVGAGTVPTVEQARAATEMQEKS